MRARALLMLLIAVPLLIISACRDKEDDIDEDWTLRKLADTPCAAHVHMNLSPLDSVVGEWEHKPVHSSSESASLTLGSDENVVTLRFSRSDLQYLEFSLKQLVKTDEFTFLDLVGDSINLKGPLASNDFDAIATLKPSKMVPFNPGPYSAEFLPGSGSLTIRLKMELLYTPKPGVKREKQRYGGQLFISVTPKS